MNLLNRSEFDAYVFMSIFFRWQFEETEYCAISKKYKCITDQKSKNENAFFVSTSRMLCILYNILIFTFAQIFTINRKVAMAETYYFNRIMSLQRWHAIDCRKIIRSSLLWKYVLYKRLKLLYIIQLHCFRLKNSDVKVSSWVNDNSSNTFSQYLLAKDKKPRMNRINCHEFEDRDLYAVL